MKFWTSLPVPKFGLLLLLVGALWAQNPLSTVPVDTTQQQPTDTTSLQDLKVSYTERNYDHKQQVVVGGVVMLCIALALVAMNNYNPKR